MIDFVRNISRLYSFLRIKLLYCVCSTSLVQRGCDFRYKQESINRELNIMISLIDKIKLRSKENNFNRLITLLTRKSIIRSISNWYDELIWERILENEINKLNLEIDKKEQIYFIVKELDHKGRSALDRIKILSEKLNCNVESVCIV